ncbi:MAG: swr1 complex component [Cirrosporium novae-zelandiae]|nr:MAG: swr1 complex component [Cirrosporium novae-zelandiae]
MNGISNHHHSNDNSEDGARGNSISLSENDDRPVKRRKLTDPALRQRSTPKPVSPPWKKISLDGPSSFMEDGRRKSSRTNTLPLELQPPAEKRQTRAAVQNSHTVKSKYGGASIPASSPLSPSISQSRMNGRRPSPANKYSHITSRSTQSNSPRPKDLPKRATPKTYGHKTTPMRTHSLNISGSHVDVQLRPKSSSPHRGRKPRKSSELNTSHRPRPTMTEQSDTSDGEKDNEEEEQEEGEVARFDQKVKLQKLKLKVKIPTVTIQHPDHIVGHRNYPSFQEWFKNEGSDGSGLNNKEAREEAFLRQRILREAQDGGVLSADKCQIYIPDAQDEPPQLYSHHDHLVVHALHLRKLLLDEHKLHRRNAKRLAHDAVMEWKRRQPKSDEQIRHEQQELTRTRYKQLVKDLEGLWTGPRLVVEKQKFERWKEEQERLDKEKLDRVLEQSTQLLDRRRVSRAQTEEFNESDEDQGIDIPEHDSGGDVSSSDESNISSSSDDSDEEKSITDVDDDKLDPEQLRQKYRGLLLGERSEESTDNEDIDHKHSEAQTVESPTPVVDYSLRSEMAQNTNDEANGEIDVPKDNLKSLQVGKASKLSTLDSVDNIQLEEVKPELLDDSDESTDMSDDMGDSDEFDSDGEESNEREDGEEGEDNNTDPGTLGFLSAADIAKIKTEPMKNKPRPPLIEEIADGDTSQDELNGSKDSTPYHSLPDAQSDIMTVNGKMQENLMSDPHASPQTIIENGFTAKTSSSPAPLSSEKSPAPPSDTTQSSNLLKTPIPSTLLRGTLREYQHRGLDWLANLYASNTNGILADEMGLGKTIQTIALLAHLALEHHVWGPHLVIVPTSVMLNWEMEFKKWCPGFKILTYYGSQEERRQKRRGWTDNNRWHVCITSYQLVLKDEVSFKKRDWHYMILDEAHNIKNFRSQRWQTLLTFKTKARLLLTGTPLQNNLTELWSLLYFILPDEKFLGEQFPDLQDFSSFFRAPETQILEQGRESLDEASRDRVTKLQEVLRPHLLRRMKADVERQMPAKHEHIVYCRLSKRQRYLYNDYMGRTKTKQSLVSGSYTQIFGCLMDLRKVCNHPDLFETRQIVTSYAMPKSIIADYEIKELLVRRQLLQNDPSDKVDLDFLNLAPISKEDVSLINSNETLRLHAYRPFQKLRAEQYGRTNWKAKGNGLSTRSALDAMENVARISRMQQLDNCIYFDSFRHRKRPIYGTGLLDTLCFDLHLASMPRPPKLKSELIQWTLNQSDTIQSMLLSVSERSNNMQPIIQKFACVTPAVRALDMSAITLGGKGIDVVREAIAQFPSDPYSESRIRLSIAFPDKRLLQYDCGKLQRLDELLRKLQVGGHRALIFTQMTKVLDILEQFLNIHGHRYLRLDGSTKVEQRQILTDRFNNDTRILAFILSSRSGGLGINLTGADTVIFYDLDWNPAMDKQCQDRCHRIGQTRDVHIYRFVSEHTIESNILRKANQKRLLDNVVIQEGEFTTEYFNKTLNVRDMFGDAALAEAGAHAAIDRVVEADQTLLEAERAKAESDKDEHEQADVAAARNAEKELAHVDDADFDERPGETPKTSSAPTPLDARYGRSTSMSVDGMEEAKETAHIDRYLLRFMEWNLRDAKFEPPPDKNKKRSRRDRDHKSRRRR